MDKERFDLLCKEAQRQRHQQQQAERNYQDTGYRRFYNASYRHEVIADALEGYLQLDDDLSRGRNAISRLRLWAGMLQDFQYRPKEQQERIVRDILAEIRIAAASH